MNNRQRIMAAVLAAAIIIMVVLFLPDAFSNDIKHPINVESYITDNADDALALRDWMRNKDIDAIRLLNKSNRSDGKGVCVQTLSLFCFFEGEGASELLNVIRIDQPVEAFNYAFELEDIAKAYGVYAYIRHDSVFEVILSANPLTRLSGAAGTSIVYSEMPMQSLEAAGYTVGEDLGGGWYTAQASQTPFIIDTHSSAFLIVMIIAAACAGRLIALLLSKKHQCVALVVGKKSEYMGHKPKIWWLISGIPRSFGRNWTAYTVVFLTDKEEKLEFYMSEFKYNDIKEGDAGNLEYKTLGNRTRFIRFSPTENKNEPGHAVWL